jgi:GntR family transcriptional regulator, rspAB operon transcriptional repressor
MIRGYDLFRLLKEDIVMLRLAPGTVFQELEIAERYGSSRTPAREAIKQLIAEGFVTTSGRRYVVKAMTLTEVRELYEYREGLEVTAIRLAVERATDDEIVGLERHMRAFREQFVAVSPDSRDGVVPSFHLEIARLAKNQKILAELERVHERIRMLMRILRVEGINAIDEHERIFSAIKRRDPAIAEAELRYHMRPVVAWYEKHCAGLPDGEASPAKIITLRKSA